MSRDDGLRRVGRRMLRRRADAGVPAGTELWPAPHFGLERVVAYTQASGATRRAILDACAAALLAESRFVERCGMEFCARMVLASDSVAERQVYSLIAADEASHYAWLEPWLAHEPARPDPFNAFLADCVASAAPPALAYLMQVVLEGFGIVHYASLADACRDPALAATLKRMSEDEALHHAAGLAAFDAGRLSDTQRRFLVDASGTLLGMIASGPLAVLAALDEALGGLDRATALALLSALDGTAATHAKLARMRRLMGQPGMTWLIDALDAQGAFTPCTPAQSAQIFCAMR